MDARDAQTRLREAGLAGAVESRASVRKYLPEPVPREDVEAMVGLALRAANASNAQMWRFVAVEDPLVQIAMRQAVDEALDRLGEWPELAGKSRELRALRTFSTFFVDAPLVMAVFVTPYQSRADEMFAAHGVGLEEAIRLRQRPDLQSIGAAVQLLITAAHVLGYGACWMTAPVLAAPAIEELLGVAPPAKLVAVVPIGRPAGRLKPSSRRPVADVLEFR